MCNAIQQRMVEEALVEKEVFEAMMTMRNRINEALGMPIPQPREARSGNYPQPKTASGRSPEWDFVYGDGNIPEPKKNKGPVSTDVMAIGDVDRDPNRPVAPYVPPTNPRPSGDPFPDLREKPMG